MSDGYAPCPSCQQYSHSIGEDRVTDAFVHFQSMIDHRGDGMPTQSAFSEQTRDYAQVLLAEITSLRAALVSIRDIEKPMFGEQPERDWLAWYSTASQMAELADDALITAKPERDE